MSEELKPTPPTCEEIYDENIGDPVHRKSDDSWRHGCYVTEVYKRDSDSTFWMVSFERSTDGESNGLREGTASITQVWPKEVTKTIYVNKKP